MVDTLVNHYNGKSVMNQSFENLTVDKFTTKREDGEFELIPKEQLVVYILQILKLYNMNTH